MNNEEKILSLMEKMYIEFSGRFEKADSHFDSIEEEVKKTNLTIENEVKPKLDTLFDGYKQNSDKLDRIETEVTKHDKFILERIK